MKRTLAKKLDMSKPVRLACGDPVTVYRTDMKSPICIAGSFIEPFGYNAGGEVIGSWFKDGAWGSAPSMDSPYNLVNCED